MRSIWLLAVSLGRPGGLTAGRFLAALIALSLLMPGTPATGEESSPLRALVRLESTVPADARTARSLGTERVGSGVVISGDGLVLTIGYLMMEAVEVFVTDIEGKRQPAEIVAYDHATGFGLVRATGPIAASVARIGDSDALDPGEEVLVAGTGGAGNVRVARVIDRRVFTGPWEYIVEQAIFTVPTIPEFGGAALFGSDGRLLGIGSLRVGDAGVPGKPLVGNMFVPISLLTPILADLLAFGESTEAARPWLGLYPVELDGILMVRRVSEGGPAERAGIVSGDILLGVGEHPVNRMEDLFRRVWDLGPAGTPVPLKVYKNGDLQDITIESADRRRWLKLRPTY
jgi:S1-C subfamily serine protease